MTDAAGLRCPAALVTNAWNGRPAGNRPQVSGLFDTCIEKQAIILIIPAAFMQPRQHGDWIMDSLLVGKLAELPQQIQRILINDRNEPGA
ncbi:hypothetical protein [Rhodopila sp.]|uniref:hypothetical protein n=1 Tax=Rhodopila sp. TaxID=2480087 RepID=UPI003D0EE375